MAKERRSAAPPEECVGLPVVPEALLLLSAAAEELPGLLVLRQLRPAQHAELTQTSVRLCPQSAPEEHAAGCEH